MMLGDQPLPIFLDTQVAFTNSRAALMTSTAGSFTSPTPTSNWCAAQGGKGVEAHADRRPPPCVACTDMARAAVCEGPCGTCGWTGRAQGQGVSLASPTACGRLR